MCIFQNEFSLAINSSGVVLIGSTKWKVEEHNHATNIFYHYFKFTIIINPSIFREVKTLITYLIIKLKNLQKVELIDLSSEKIARSLGGSQTNLIHWVSPRTQTKKIVFNGNVLRRVSMLHLDCLKSINSEVEVRAIFIEMQSINDKKRWKKNGARRATEWRQMI